MFKSLMRVISVRVFSMVAFDKIVLNVFEKWSVNCNDKCGGLYVVQERIFLGFLIRVSIQIDSIFDNSKFFLCTKSCLLEI